MTPIAFNLTPRLKACIPSGRDYSTLLALYEALQEAAVFDLISPEPISTGSETKADADGWIEWVGGDQPVEDHFIVEVKYRDGEYPVYRLKSPNVAREFTWRQFGGVSDIIAYRVVKP